MSRRLNFDEKLKQERRLRILQILHGVGAETSHRIIQTELRAGYTIRVSEDVVKADLAWLVDLGLARSEGLTSDLVVAVLTTQGAEVAEGIVTVPGIRRAVAWER